MEIYPRIKYPLLSEQSCLIINFDKFYLNYCLIIDYAHQYMDKPGQVWTDIAHYLNVAKKC